MTIQYATDAGGVPPRNRLRAWASAAQEQPLGVTLRLVDEAEGRRLNREFRGKDYATNVLTFTYGDTQPMSGDIVICAPVVTAEAGVEDKALEAHYAHLVVHGMLHLQGYDHEDDAEAALMEARETEILTKLGYADPYAVAVKGDRERSSQAVDNH